MGDRFGARHPDILRHHGIERPPNIDEQQARLSHSVYLFQNAGDSRARAVKISSRETIMEGKPHNKVLAAQLLLGQRARGLQMGEPEQWHLSAATMLLSGIVVRGAES